MAERGSVAELRARVVCHVWHTTFLPLPLVTVGLARADRVVVGTFSNHLNKALNSADSFSRFSRTGAGRKGGKPAGVENEIPRSCTTGSPSP